VRLEVLVPVAVESAITWDNTAAYSVGNLVLSGYQEDNILYICTSCSDAPQISSAIHLKRIYFIFKECISPTLT
jgi:hypothetical protein